MIKNRIVIGLPLIAATCLVPAASTGAVPPTSTDTHAAQVTVPQVDEEVIRLRQALRQEVREAIIDPPKREEAWVARAQAAISASGYKVERPQLVVVVDRNPRVQQMRIVLVRPDGPWQSLGGAKVSTGRPAGFEHFLTPTGAFRHTRAILDWRAEGTYNEHNVRGLGLPGMRVWDFGWQNAFKGWGPTGEVGKMRLLLHATDPTMLERRIGRAASNGCVRIPTAMDRFLDVHGVLDSDYERVSQRKKRFAALLLSDRMPTPLAGDALIVIDSSQSPPR